MVQVLYDKSKSKCCNTKNYFWSKLFDLQTEKVHPLFSIHPTYPKFNMLSHMRALGLMVAWNPQEKCSFGGRAKSVIPEFGEETLDPLY